MAWPNTLDSEPADQAFFLTHRKHILNSRLAAELTSARAPGGAHLPAGITGTQAHHMPTFPPFTYCVKELPLTVLTGVTNPVTAH